MVERKNLIVLLIATLLVIVLPVLAGCSGSLPLDVVSAAQGQDPPGGSGSGSSYAGACSLRTLKGMYGFAEQGTLIGAPPVPYVGIGVITYDGNGNVSGTFTANLGGQIESATMTGGHYTVSTDCKYTDQLPTPLGFTWTDVGTITRRGESLEVHYMSTNAGIVGVGTIKKTPTEGCSVASLKGTYGDLEEITVLQTIPGIPATPPFPATESATVTFDGAGNITAVTGTENVFGMVSTGSASGTYKVKSDCTYTDSGVLANGMPFGHAGVITGEGMFPVVRYIFTEPPVFLGGGILNKE